MDVMLHPMLSGEKTAALLLLAAFVLVTALGPWVERFCRRHGLVATIDHRRAHHLPTPHGGGVLVVGVGVSLGLLAVRLLDLPNEAFLNGMLVASLAIAAVGWLDDKHTLTARTRWLVHLSAVAAGLALLPPLFDFMPLWLEKLFLLLAWGWFVSLYNFMDGADGQTSAEAVVIGLGLCLMVPALAPLGAIIIGCGLGFLRMNWAPARLFIGDVGATWLGYVLGGLLLLALVDDTWRVLFPLATVTLVFCADATWTLLRRIQEGYQPWEPHKTFWFHRLLATMHDRPLPHRALALRVLAVNTLLLVLALAGFYLTRFSLWWGPATFGAGLAVLAVVARRIRCYEGRQRSFVNGRQPRRERKPR